MSQQGAPKLELDAAGLDSFRAWYRKLPEDTQTVRFFDRKTCFSVHGEPAFMVARHLYRSTAQVSYIGPRETGLPGITVSYNLFPGILKELLVERGEHAVEVYEGAGSSWKCIKRGSPGLWRDFEADLSKAGDLSDSPIIVGISLGQVESVRTVGLAFCDTSSRRLGACEFPDDEHFCQLETALSQLGAREAVLPKDLLPSSNTTVAADNGSGDNTADGGKSGGGVSAADRARLADVLSRCNTMPSERPRPFFSPKSLPQDLGRLLKGGPDSVESHRPILDKNLASSALAGVIGFSEVLSDDTSHGKFNLEVFSTGKFMRIDAAAQRALNILRGRDDATDSFSLYGLLNRGKTAMGKRLLKSWLKQPLLDPVEISKRHDVVEAFVSDASLRADLAGLHLRGLPDIERLTSKLERKAATLQDLCQLYRASSRLPMIEAALRAHAGLHAAALESRFATPLAEAHDADHLTKFEELLEAAVDLDRIPDEYLIAASYDEGLEELQTRKIEVESEIQQLAEEAASDLGLVLDKTIKLEWHKQANQRLRCLRITAKEERVVRKKLQARYFELETRKDGMKFTNRALRSAAEKLQKLSGEYDSRQSALVAQVVGVAATFAEVWQRVGVLLAELDVLCGFADVAVSAPRPYVRPEMLARDAGELEFIACRHPCVEAQDGVDFIANDAIMKRGDSWFQLITGPNMGGKSTFVRQVGVCVVLAQIGSFVPCDSAKIAVRDAVFARVGAGDCQMRGVSTFMAEMLETSAILKGATPASLVIIDELGRGTSTWDGMGLAWAISEHLMTEIGASTMFATHFHELTALQGPGGVKNLHVKSAIDADAGGLTMLYEVKEGSCDQSLGIHVAEFARFPPEVVEAAKKKAAELEAYLPANTEAGKNNATNGGKKRKGDVAAALREALVQFAGENFGELQGEELQKAAGKWAEELTAVGGNVGVKAKAGEVVEAS
ncbi:hypothetical protein Ndes2526B_g00726 [Nannochloris sp. 'desiccata']|nr:putative DNA mismatch repair protein MSH2 [Chlorella desiccata (nom. nud.)]